MARSKSASQYVCQSCAATFPKWEGQCRACGAWNSLVETLIRPSDRRVKRRSGAALPASSEPQPLGALEATRTPRRSTGIA